MLSKHFQGCCESAFQPLIGKRLTPWCCWHYCGEQCCFCATLTSPTQKDFRVILLAQHHGMMIWSKPVPFGDPFESERWLRTLQGWFQETENTPWAKILWLDFSFHCVGNAHRVQFNYFQFNAIIPSSLTMSVISVSSTHLPAVCSGKRWLVVILSAQACDRHSIVSSLLAKHFFDDTIPPMRRLTT